MPVWMRYLLISFLALGFSMWDLSGRNIAGSQTPLPAPPAVPPPAPLAGTQTPKLEIRNLQMLEFGRITADELLGGQVVIDPANGSKSLVRAHNLGGRHARAEFEIIGEPNRSFIITLPEKASLPSSSGQSLQLSDFTAHPGLTGKIGPDGKALVYVGATLTLAPKQPGGQSTGMVDIFVDYLP